MFSDGYTDQFGGPNDKKYMIKNFIADIEEVQDVDFAEQTNYLVNKFDTWQGNREQVDDILLIGVKIPG